MVKLLLWSIPLALVPASWVFYRYVPFRRVRWWCYAAVLAGAFALNLPRISFWNEFLDAVELMCVNFILAEYFWILLKVKNRRFFMVLLVIALCGYGFELRHWFAAGPGHALELWNTPAASTYRHGGNVYAVREYGLYASAQPARSIVLWKKLGKWPFERQIKSYRTPAGFGDVAITYQWSETNEGVRLDLHAAGYRLWTMGEGF